MKSSPELIAMLNERLSEEHAAVIQYNAHAAMCHNCGYDKLAEYITKRANDEAEHAKELMGRILYLGGSISILIGESSLGACVIEMFPVDEQAELKAIAGYSVGIELCLKEKDNGTRKLLEHILEEEENHLNEIEMNMMQITKMGIENYLPMQIAR